ncbi:MAG: hypothetical protein AUH43_00485 [Acidobacteria bacterium 13_1_40CM_65_14]|nr:MAG: hypothetical protein AUH43_00485 [Acidobacteria bacterium 13_1_40CM_65_14]
MYATGQRETHPDMIHSLRHLRFVAFLTESTLKKSRRPTARSLPSTGSRVERLMDDPRSDAVRQYDMPSTSAYDQPLAAFFSMVDAAGVTAAYLFGSHAEGRAHRESDIDVAVLLDRARYPDEPSRFEVRLRLIGALGGALKSNHVDLVVLNDAPPSLARAIITRGRRVFCRNLEADHEFVRTTLLRAADLEPWLRRMRRIKLEAVRR